jgi:hypothetical protein
MRGEKVPCDIETQTTATPATGGRGDELAPEFCEFSLELTDVVARGLIFLSWRKGSYQQGRGRFGSNTLLACKQKSDHWKDGN